MGSLGRAITPPRGWMGGAGAAWFDRALNTGSHVTYCSLSIDRSMDPRRPRLTSCSGLRPGQPGDGIHFELTRLTGPGPGTAAGRPVAARHRLHVGAARARAPCPHASGTPDEPKTVSRSRSRPALAYVEKPRRCLPPAAARRRQRIRHTPVSPSCQQAPVSATGLRAFHARDINRVTGEAVIG